MKGFLKGVIGLGLVATLSLSESLPIWADGSPRPAWASQQKSPIDSTPAKLDLSTLKGSSHWAAPGSRLAERAELRQVHFQAGAGGGTKMSGAKKAWIIVGIVVGAAVVVAVIRGNHDDNGGGGGY